MSGCNVLLQHHQGVTFFPPAGRPTPTVQWRVNDEVWPSEETQEPEGVTKVTLRVTELGRRHLHAVFECRATNFNDSSPISATVTLDMNCEWQATTIPTSPPSPFPPSPSPPPPYT